MTLPDPRRAVRADAIPPSWRRRRPARAARPATIGIVLIAIVCLAGCGAASTVRSSAASPGPALSVAGGGSPRGPAASPDLPVSEAPGSAAPELTPTGSAAPEPTPSRKPARSHEPLPSLEPLPPLDPDTPRPELSHEVVAYLPYWMVSGAFSQQAPPVDPATDPYIGGGRLTDLVLFSVGVRRDGSLKLDTPGARFVLGDSGSDIITAAHAHGIRVLVSFTMGGYANNDALFGDPAALDRFIAEAVALIRLRSLDGADMDVELIKRPRFAAYAETAGRLKAALLAGDPNARVTVATNGAASGSRMASMALAAGADRAFLMGYAYRGRGSSPVGSISPIAMVDGLDLRDSLDLYAKRSVPLDRVIVGLPAYGLTWATVGPELHAKRAPARVSSGGRVTFFAEAAAEPQASGAVRDTDPVESAARVTWYDPRRKTWLQTYYDTPDTLRAKYLLAFEHGLAGVGMWTLGYDGGLPGYVDLVRDVFSLPLVATVRVDPAVARTPSVTVSALLYDGLSATSDVRLSNDGQTWGAWLPAAGAATMAWLLDDGADGPRTVSVQSRDVDGRLSAVLSAGVLLDRAPPVIDSFDLRPAPIPGWMATFHAADANGIARTELRWKVGTGAWSPWRPVTSLAAGSVAAEPGTPVRAELRVTDGAGNTATAAVSSP